MKILLANLLILAMSVWQARGDDYTTDMASAFEGQQLPTRMHAAMKVLPSIKVGLAGADIIGSDNRALQAAVDYIAALGGGTVDIGPGEYLMRDSLHLRSRVTIRGEPGKTVLRKAGSAASPLAVDGDFGEEQVTVSNASGFEVGAGIAIWDKQAGGFHTTVARITGRTGNTFSLDKPLMSDCMAANGGQAATVFPVVSGYDVEGARLSHLIIDGNKEHNGPLNGCRGAGIFLYRAFGTVIEHCQVRNYQGDGIGFQQSNDVIVQDCISEGNAVLGFHPGSGSQRPVVRRCAARNNGEDGLFLCWRVRYGVFEDNCFEKNGRFGISIGHKDTDNLIRANKVAGNGEDGICFRNETLGMAGHRNRLEKNLVENNGQKKEAAGIRVRGETRDLILQGNIIRDTRENRLQKVGILFENKAGPALLENNKIEADIPIQDMRGQAQKSK